MKARTEGRAADLAPVINELRARGVTTLAGLAHALTVRRIPTARRGIGVERSAGIAGTKPSRAQPPFRRRRKRSRRAMTR